MIRASQITHERPTLKPTSRLNGCGTTSVSELTLEALFESEETNLLRFAFHFVGRRAVAEEIVQDVFLKLHVHWSEVESPKAWLYQSVKNRAYTWVRDNKREVLNEYGSELSPVDGDGDAPEVSLAQIEAIGAVRRMLEELDEADRELVKLKYFSNLKYRDISTQTGLNIGNVGYRLHHILKKLANELRKLGFDETS